MSKNEIKAEHLRLIKSERWSFEDIITFLPKQISLRNLDQELVNALADDTHQISVWIRNQYVVATKKNGQIYYAWNKERRFFILMINTIFRRGEFPHLLEKAVELPYLYRTISQHQGWTLGFDKQLNKSQKYEYRYSKTMNNFPYELRHIGTILTKTKPAIPYIKGINNIQFQFNNRRLSKGLLNINLSSLLNQNACRKLIEPNTIFHRKWIEDFWHQRQPFLEDGKSPLEFAKSLLKEKQNSNKFTRKFSRYIVNCVNGYWFRVYHVEKKNHGKIKRNKTRFVPVKDYSTFGKALCLYYGCSGNEKLFRDIFNDDQRKIILQNLVPLDFENNLTIAWDWVLRKYKHKKMEYVSQQNEGLELEEISFEHYQPSNDEDDKVLCSINLEKEFERNKNNDEYSCPECGHVIPNPSPGKKKFSEIGNKPQKLNAKSRKMKMKIQTYSKKKSWEVKLITIKNEILMENIFDGDQATLINDGLAKEIQTLEQIKDLKKRPENSDKKIRLEPKQDMVYEKYYSNEEE
jgi:hypothetical protein